METIKRTPANTAEGPFNRVGSGQQGLVLSTLDPAFLQAAPIAANPLEFFWPHCCKACGFFNALFSIRRVTCQRCDSRDYFPRDRIRAKWLDSSTPIRGVRHLAGIFQVDCLPVKLIRHHTLAETKMKRRPENGWKKIVAFGLLALLVGYVYSRPTLERWIGMELPAILSDAAQPNVADKKATQPQIAAKPDASQRTEEGEFPFTKLDKSRLRSPAGLIYGMGPNGEHRVDHVLRHSVDDAGRPGIHGVFEGGRNKTLEVIDEAYELVKAHSKRVEQQNSDERTTFTVNMERKVGYEGGKAGKQNNHPQLRRVRLVVEDENIVITAYPCR